MSLEVDHRMGASDREQSHKEAYNRSNEKETYRLTSTAVNDGPILHASAPAVPPRPKRSTTWLLAISLAAVTVLAIVAAAAAGSTAVMRKNDLEAVRSRLRESELALQQYISDHDGETSNTTSTLQPSIDANANDTTNNATYFVAMKNLKPTSNCSSIGSGETYIAAFTKLPFIVRCEIDYTGGDAMGVWVFTFADCIEACASWNDHNVDPPCYAVSYDTSDAFTEEGGIGNCFLKGLKGIPPKAKRVTDSAVADLGD